MERKLNIIGADAKIEEISYKYYGELNDNDKITLNQEIILIDCSENNIKIKMTRRISFEKETGFLLYVSCIADFMLKKGTYDNFNNLDEMRSYAEEKKSILVDNIQLGSHLSQIIADITGKFGNTPLILPPILRNGD